MSGGPSVEGVVPALLPSGLYSVKIDGRHPVTAHVGEGAGKNFVRLVVGDRVAVVLTQQDLTRGRSIEGR